MIATSWSCFRRIGDDREALAYGGGCEVFRGGIAKCMVETERGTRWRCWQLRARGQQAFKGQ